MILLSLRKDFCDRLMFSAAPQWRIPPGETTFNRRCLFMIHGYENTAGSAEANFAAIEHGITEAGLYGPGKRFDQLVGVLWPGQTALGFWLAEMAADRAAGLLRKELSHMPPPASVSFVTHSLGARVALGVATIPSPLEIRELVMLAPAVDDNALDRAKTYLSAAQTLVCYSRRDEVLGVWFRRFSAFLNFNDVALGFNGPRDPLKCCPGVTGFDGTAFVDSHGGWMTCPQMYDTWRNWIGGA